MCVMGTVCKVVVRRALSSAAPRASDVVGAVKMNCVPIIEHRPLHLPTHKEHNPVAYHGTQLGTYPWIQLSYIRVRQV